MVKFAPASSTVARILSAISSKVISAVTSKVTPFMVMLPSSVPNFALASAVKVFRAKVESLIVKVYSPAFTLSDTAILVTSSA